MKSLDSILDLQYFDRQQGLMYLKNGDISFGLQLQLPSVYSLSSDDFLEIEQVFFSLYNVLPSFVCLHKQDVVIPHHFVVERNKLSKSHGFYYDWDKKITQDSLDYTHFCNLYVSTFLASEFIRDKYSFNFNFSTHSHTHRKRKLSSSFAIDFVALRDKIANIINASKLIKCSYLDTTEKCLNDDGVLNRYFTFANKDNKLQNIVFNDNNVLFASAYSKVLTINNNYCFNVNSIAEGFNKQQSNSGIFSYAYPLSLGLKNIPHVYNQIVFKYSKSFIDQLFSKAEYSLKNFANKHNEEQHFSYIQYFSEIKDMINNDEDDVVFTNVNVLYSYPVHADPASIVDIDKYVKGAFSRMSMNPVEVKGNLLKHYCLANVPFCASMFFQNECFISLYSLWVRLLSKETKSNYLTTDGLVVLDREDLPLALNFGLENKNVGNIDNFNVGVFGTSGSGKSAFVNSLVLSGIYAGEKIFIQDKGRSYTGIIDSLGDSALFMEHVPHKDQYYSFSTFHITREEYKDSTYFNDFVVHLIVSILKSLYLDNIDDLKLKNTVLLENLVISFYQDYFNRYGYGGKNTERIKFNDFYDYVKKHKKSFVVPGVIDISEIDEFLYITQKYYYTDGSTANQLLLNSDSDLDLDSYSLVVFEMNGIDDLPVFKRIIFLYLSLTVSRNINSDKKQFSLFRLILEECWSYLEGDKFVLRFIDWLSRTGRKHDGGLVLVSQKYEDFLLSSLGSSLIDMCDTYMLCALDKYAKQNSEKVRAVFGIDIDEYKDLLSLNASDYPKKYPSSREFFLKYRKSKGFIFRVYLTPILYLLFQTDDTIKSTIERFSDEKKIRYVETIKLFALNYKEFLNLYEKYGRDREVFYKNILKMHDFNNVLKN